METTHPQHRFEISKAVRYAWETLKKNFKFLFFSVIVYTIIDRGFSLLHVSVVGSRATRTSFQDMLDVVLTIIELIISLTFAIGFVRIGLSFVDGKKPQYAYLWDNLNRKMWYVFLSALLYILFVFVGLILLIVPGIYVALKYQYFLYFIIEKNMGPIESLKESGKITRGNLWRLFVLALVLVGIAIGVLSVFLLILVGTAKSFGDLSPIMVWVVGVIGMVFVFLTTSPFLTLIHTYVYRKLSGGHISEPKELTSNVPFLPKAS